jgi:hypothetical protein
MVGNARKLAVLSMSSSCTLPNEIYDRHPINPLVVARYATVSNDRIFLRQQSTPNAAGNERRFFLDTQ